MPQVNWLIRTFNKLEEYKIVQVLIIFLKLFFIVIEEIANGIFVTLSRLFEEDGQVRLLLDYLLPFLYFFSAE